MPAAFACRILRSERFQHRDLTGDVDVVRAGREAGIGHRLRGLGERSGRVDHRGDSRQRGAQTLRIIEGRGPRLEPEPGGEGRSLSGSRPARIGLQAVRASVLGQERPGIAGGAVDQDRGHGRPCSTARRRSDPGRSAGTGRPRGRLWRRRRSGKSDRPRSGRTVRRVRDAQRTAIQPAAAAELRLSAGARHPCAGRPLNGGGKGRSLTREGTEPYGPREPSCPDPGVAHPPAVPESDPFAAFADELVALPPLRAAMAAACRRPEPDCVPPLLDGARLPPEAAGRVAATARHLVETLRARPGAAASRG